MTTRLNSQILRVPFLFPSKRWVQKPTLRLFQTSTQQNANSGTNAIWFLGSAIVFGPLLFYLTSPPSTQNKKPQISSISKSSNLRSSDKSNSYDYILVGSGTASYHALLKIRNKEPNSKVLIVGEEDSVPYFRFPLSKDILTSSAFDTKKDLLEKICYEPKSFYENQNIDLRLGSPVTEINPDMQTITLKNKQTFCYGKLLLATGLSGKKHPLISKLPEKVQSKVSTFRTIEDAMILREKLANNKRFIIFGGGLLGSELAFALCQIAKQNDISLSLTQIVPEEWHLGKIIPSYLGQLPLNLFRNNGVEVITNNDIHRIEEKEDNSLTITLANGQCLDADEVIIATGYPAETSLAETSGLEIDSLHGGILVNCELQARTNIYSAGDVASYFEPILGRRRVEHYDHAVRSGQVAGENMTGAKQAYAHIPEFCSSLGHEISVEGVGMTDSSLPTVGIWKNREHDQGAVLYLREDKIVGVLLWRLHGAIDEARKLIGKPQSQVTKKDLIKYFGL